RRTAAPNSGAPTAPSRKAGTTSPPSASQNPRTSSRCSASCSRRRRLPVADYLFTESEWDFSTVERTYKAIEDIALNDLKLDVYPNQIEIISSEQMLDAYSSLAMPLMYNHWS